MKTVSSIAANTVIFVMWQITFYQVHPNIFHLSSIFLIPQVLSIYNSEGFSYF